LRLRIGAQRAGAGSAAPVKLPVFRGKGGLMPSVDPLSNRSMLAAAADDDA